MKKIHKNVVNTAKTESIKNSFNGDFWQIVPNLMKLLPSFDVQKHHIPTFSNTQNTANTNSKKAICAHRAKICSAYLQNHQKLMENIKQKNRPNSL